MFTFSVRANLSSDNAALDSFKYHPVLMDDGDATDTPIASEGFVLGCDEADDLAGSFSRQNVDANVAVKQSVVILLERIGNYDGRFDYVTGYGSLEIGLRLEIIETGFEDALNLVRTMGEQGKFHR